MGRRVVWGQAWQWRQKVGGADGERERVRVELCGESFGTGGEWQEDGLDLEKNILPYLKCFLCTETQPWGVAFHFIAEIQR